MSNLEQDINKERQRYFQYVDINQGKKIFIYGAGKQASQIADFFVQNSINFDGFCVTDGKANKKIQKGKPVFDINELNLQNKNVAFIIGVRVQLNEEIISILNEHGYSNYLESSDLVRYLGEYGYNYYKNPMMEITTQIGCAVNCRYCPQDVFIKKYMKTDCADRILTLDNFKKFINKLPLNTLIEFAGFTEPFFNPQCIDMIKYAYDKGFKLSMFTTLRGVTKDILNQMIKIPFEEFVLHVPDIEGYSNIPVDGEYFEILETLVDAKKPNGDDYIDYASAQGTVLDEVKSVLANKVRIYVVLNDRAGNLSDKSLYCQKGIRGSIRCELSENIDHNVLLPDGRVLLCANDWGMKHVLGNLKYQTYNEIINGSIAVDIREKMKDENDMSILCRNCFQTIIVK